MKKCSEVEMIGALKQMEASGAREAAVLIPAAAVEAGGEGDLENNKNNT